MKKSKPLVSIIMNCHNGETFLRKAIDSIYAQTYSNWEIIFWDNCSTDNSAFISKSYDKKIKYHLSNKKTPLGEARNLALKKTIGKYIAFLDCDDLYESKKLQKQTLFMEGGDYLYCYGSSIIINEKGKEIDRITTNNKSGNIFGNLLENYNINMQTVMIRRDALNDRSFNTSLTFSPDYNLFMKLASTGRVGVISDHIVRYRKTNNSLTVNSTYKIYKENKYTLDHLCSDKKLLKKYNKEFRYAYKKLNYAKAIYLIEVEDYKGARSACKQIVSIKFKYRVFYYLLYLPVSKKFLIKKLLGF